MPVIERNIPIPPVCFNHTTPDFDGRELLKIMKPGESVFFPDVSTTQVYAMRPVRFHKGGDLRLVVRAMPGGCRVWVLRR